MAIRQLNDFAAGDSNLTAMMETLNKAYKGQSNITISEYDTDLAPVVKIGSVFDNNGSQFIVETADETPSGYSGIAISTTFYLYWDESASAFIFLATAPVWSDDLQGWYNGNDRAFFSMYKDSGGTLYQSKRKLTENILMINNSLHVSKEMSADYNLPDLALYQSGIINIHMNTEIVTRYLKLPLTGNFDYTTLIFNFTSPSTGFSLSKNNEPGGAVITTTSTSFDRMLNISYKRIS